MCTPPFGLFSSGFLPFYPFNAPEFAQTTPDLNETQTSTLQFPIPLQAFRTPQSHLGGASSLKKRGNEKRNRAVSMSTFKEKVSAVDFDSGISSSERDDGNIEVVNNVLMRFDVVRRRLSQLEKVKEALVGLLRRADLKASNILMGKGVRTNMKKTIGIVPGVEVRYKFFFFFRWRYVWWVYIHRPWVALTIWFPKQNHQKSQLQSTLFYPVGMMMMQRILMS